MSSKPKYVKIEGRRVLKKFPTKKTEEKPPAKPARGVPRGMGKSQKAAFVRKEIAAGRLKKVGDRIVKATPEPVVGPRNLKKGFGIKRMPKKEEPKPKKKTAPKVKDGKKKVSTFTFKEIVDDNPEEFLYPAEENVMDSLDYSDFSWIQGVSDSMVSFYKNNQYRFDSLSERKRDRMEKIYEKINDGVRPSLLKEFRREFKKWKEANKDERMTEKEAIKSFETYYF